MDFGTLLHVAKQKNEELAKNSGNKYYSTKFSAPKKESKDKKLSDNIKKFLAKKEQEEREKARIEKQKRDQLIAMRDDKAKNKIKKMLKVIKSANKSVLDDAVDEQNTSVTINGPDQPDEDDYGYVSNEASALYQKYMERVKTIPEDNKFTPSRPSSKTDLAGTKDRVRAAIMREQEEMNSGNRTKSSSSSTVAPSKVPEPSKESDSRSEMSMKSHRRKDLYDPEAEREAEERRKREEAQKRAKSRPQGPPPMDFASLLKLAEKKQHEPLEIVVEPKKEPERLLTKKEKKELEEQERREQRRKEMKAMNGGASSAGGNKMQPNGRIPKLNDASSAVTNDKSSRPIPKQVQPSPKPSSSDTFKKPAIPTRHPKVESTKSRPDGKSSSISDLKSKSQPSISSASRPPSMPKPSSTAASSTKLSSSVKSSTSKSSSLSAPSSSSQSHKSLPKQASNGPTREFPPRDTNPAKKPQLQNGRPSGKPNGVSREAQKTRQFPPPDVRRRPEPPKKPAVKRRIYDDYDDDEYDSELDDFIDDGPEEEENYSSYIKEIFGYDKSKYRYAEEDDDAAMESSFHQQMHEEYISKKIGIMEDLEDMRLEEQEKKRKAQMKKRKLK